MKGYKKGQLSFSNYIMIFFLLIMEIGSLPLLQQFGDGVIAQLNPASGSYDITVFAIQIVPIGLIICTLAYALWVSNPQRQMQ